MSDSENSLSRLAQLEKCEFTFVKDHFESKCNADIGLYGQTLFDEKTTKYKLERTSKNVKVFLMQSQSLRI